MYPSPVLKTVLLIVVASLQPVTLWPDRMRATTVCRDLKVRHSNGVRLGKEMVSVTLLKNGSKVMPQCFTPREEYEGIAS